MQQKETHKDLMPASSTKRKIKTNMPSPLGDQHGKNPKGKLDNTLQKSTHFRARLIILKSKSQSLVFRCCNHHVDVPIIGSKLYLTNPLIMETGSQKSLVKEVFKILTPPIPAARERERAHQDPKEVLLDSQSNNKPGREMALIQPY